jgi:hypothetical protein
VSPAGSVTILRARGRRLAKTIHPDGTIDQYDYVRTVDLIEHPIADLAALEKLLRLLERRRDCSIVRGKPVDPNSVKAVRRLLYPDRETGEPPTLAEVPRRWVSLDFDGLSKPDWVDPVDLLGCACVAIRTLPIEFRQATLIVQATACHGLKPGIRIRLWAWLSRPVLGEELKYWFRSAPVDRAIFGAAQVIYTAAPVFLPGSFDPLPTRIDTIPGHETVPVPAPARLKPVNPPRLPPESQVHGNISGLIRTVETATKEQNRNNALYWAACRVAENPDINHHAAARDLVRAAIHAGLSEKEAAATVRSGLRHGGRHG